MVRWKRCLELSEKEVLITATKKDRANNHAQEKALPFLVAKR